jgi:hypothetical protein
MKFLTKLIILITVSLLIPKHLFCQNLPIGYIEMYSEKCANDKFFKTFYPEDTSNWKFITVNNTKTLLIKPNDISGNPASPKVRGIIRYYSFGDFILEFEFKTIQKPGTKDGFCFLGPVKTDMTYYAFRFSSDSVTFSFINRGENKMVESQPANKLHEGWNKVRVERDILNRKVSLIINGDYAHRNEFRELTLVKGFVGFGSESVKCFLRNIKIWAPTSISDSTFIWH